MLQTVIRKWRRFSNLAGFERTIVVEAAAGLVATRVGLRVLGFRRWKAVLSHLAPPLRERDLAPLIGDSVKMVLQMESAAARNLFFRPNCLERSMILWWLLRSRGIAADLRFGARKHGQRFEAHAWVECCGVVLDGPDETHLEFVPFDGPITALDTPVR
jgi:hypothetical protein